MSKEEQIYKLFAEHVDSGKPFYYQLKDGSIVPHGELLEGILSIEAETRKQTELDLYMELKSKAIARNGLTPGEIEEIFAKYGIQETEKNE